MFDIFDLYYNSAHRNVELEQTIDDMQKENKRLRIVIDVKDNERIELVKKNKEQQQTIDILCKENIMLRHELNEVKNNDNNY